jgi:hypothetical protein
MLPAVRWLLPDAHVIVLPDMEIATARPSHIAVAHSRPPKTILAELGVSEETLENLLRGLMAAGQVVMVSVGGRIVYRMAG